LRNQTTYEDVSPTVLAERRRQQAEHRAIRQLRALGYDVTITPKSTAA
jgi:hypothetical protein